MKSARLSPIARAHAPATITTIATLVSPTHTVRRIGRFALGCAIAATALTSVSFAVPALAAESTAFIEEIIVTARKRKEVVQDVPIAMTAFTAELQESQIRKLSDLNGFAPNVVIGEASGRPGGTQIQIRGVAASELTDKSHDSPIAVSIDGVFLGTFTGRNVPNFDLERIEILRGPQGTLFGKNTVGGVINVVRSRPTGEWGAKIKLTGGEDGQEEIRGVVNFPLLDETLAGKAFFTQIKNDGWMRNTFTGDDGPATDYQNYGLTLLWTPTEDFEAQLTVEQYKDESDLGAFANYNFPAGFFPPPDPNELGARDLSGGFFACNVIGNCRTTLSEPDTYETSTSNDGRYKNNAFTLNMSYELADNLTLVSVTGYHDTPYEDYLNELDGIQEEFILIDNDNEYEQFTQELRLEGTWDKLDYVVGGYYLDSTYEQDWVTLGSFWTTVSTVIGLPVAFDGPTADLCRAGVFAPLVCDTGQAAGEPLGPNFVQKLYQEQDTESWAVFFQGDYALTEQWTLTAGVRYTDEKKDFTGWQSYLAPLDRARVFNFPEKTDLSNDWQETTIRLGVKYAMTDDVMFYASYAEGFKSGGFFGRNQNISDFENNQYDPEKSDNYELGMKSQWFDNRVQLNLAVFYNNFDDKQDSNVVLDESTGTVATVWENIGGVDYTGVEAEARWAATANLSLWASAGWLDAEYDGFLSSRFVPLEDQATTPPQNVDFLTVKFAPEYTFGLGGTYARQIGPGEFSLNAKYNYIDDMETQTYNEPGSIVESRDLVDASVSYAWRNFTFSVFGNNLMDETRETPFFAVQPWMAWSTVTRGRTFGAELEMDF